MDTKNVVLAVSSGSDSAVVFVDGKRTDVGHIADVQERLIETLGVRVEYVPTVIVDKAGSGWLGVAERQSELDL